MIIQIKKWLRTPMNIISYNRIMRGLIGGIIGGVVGSLMARLILGVL